MKTTFRSIYPGYTLGDHKFHDNLLVIEDEAEVERLKKVKGYGQAFFVDETLSDKAPVPEASTASTNVIITASNPVVPDGAKVMEALGINGTGGSGTASNAEGEGQHAGDTPGDADEAAPKKPKKGK